MARGRRTAARTLVMLTAAAGVVGCSWIVGVSDDPTVVEAVDVPDAANERAFFPDVVIPGPPDAHEDAAEAEAGDGGLDV